MGRQPASQVFQCEEIYPHNAVSRMLANVVDYVLEAVGDEGKSFLVLRGSLKQTAIF